MLVTEIPAADIRIRATRPADRVTLDNLPGGRAAIVGNWMTSQAREAFDRVLETHDGAFQRYTALQDQWLGRIDAAASAVFVERDAPRDVVFTRLIDELDPATLKQRAMVVVGAQMVQNAAWSSSTPAHILKHVGGTGISCTVSQCGLSTAYQALEVAAHLCCAETADTLLLLAGDILPAEYPRLLASLASVSDGAGALLISLRDAAAPPTIYVVTEASAPAGGLDPDAPTDELRRSVRRVFPAADDLLSHANIADRSSVFFCAPKTQIMRDQQVDAEAAEAGYRISASVADTYEHFGAADMLFRMRALSDDAGGALSLPEWILIWDIDPQGGLALLLLSRDLLTEAPRRKTLPCCATH